MLWFAGLFSLACSGVVAYLSPRYPAHIEALETATGFLLIAGFALTACGLPAIL